LRRLLAAAAAEVAEDGDAGADAAARAAAVGPARFASMVAARALGAVDAAKRVPGARYPALPDLEACRADAATLAAPPPLAPREEAGAAALPEALNAARGAFEADDTLPTRAVAAAGAALGFAWQRAGGGRPMRLPFRLVAAAVFAAQGFAASPTRGETLASARGLTRALAAGAGSAFAKQRGALGRAAAACTCLAWEAAAAGAGEGRRVAEAAVRLFAALLRAMPPGVRTAERGSAALTCGGALTAAAVAALAPPGAGAGPDTWALVADAALAASKDHDPARYAEGLAPGAVTALAAAPEALLAAIRAAGRDLPVLFATTPEAHYAAESAAGRRRAAPRSAEAALDACLEHAWEADAFEAAGDGAPVQRALADALVELAQRALAPRTLELLLLVGADLMDNPEARPRIAAAEVRPGATLAAHAADTRRRRGPSPRRSSS
jgi:hypothetical protein